MKNETGPLRAKAVRILQTLEEVFAVVLSEKLTEDSEFTFSIEWPDYLPFQFITR